MASLTGREQGGMRETPARRKVLGLLSASKRPLSVKDLVSKLPGADTVTVYRTVDALVKAGRAKRVDLGGRAALYESSDRHHHHIVCTSCGKIEDFEDCALGGAEKAILGHSKSFARITDHSFELFGLCVACDKR